MCLNVFPHPTSCTHPHPRKCSVLTLLDFHISGKSALPCGNQAKGSDLSLKHMLLSQFVFGFVFLQNIVFLSPLKDLEMENMDQKLSENDSHKQNSEEATSASQDVGAVSEEPEEGESSDMTDPDSLPPAHTDSDSVSISDQDSFVPGTDEASAPEPACMQGDTQPQEQKTETESNSKVNWDNKVQPMESILADWNEDIEAFEMMEKDEL